MEILLVLLASILYRKILRKPIIKPSYDTTLYQDTWISGHSFNIFQILGGARNCLYINITKDKVFIHPHFLFSLLFLPEILGCEWTFNKTELISAEKSILSVIVSYRFNNKIRVFRIFPSDKQKFIDAIYT